MSCRPLRNTPQATSMSTLRCLWLSSMLINWTSPILSADEPATLPTTLSLQQKLESQIKTFSQQIEAAPDDINLYSRRGDVNFFAGNYAAAVADYSKMVELDPQTDTSHWRRGIAYFYNGQFAAAAAQFDRYHSFDDVDRENGIWRYLSQYRSKGAGEARKELLKYDKDDREPFGDVYQLFAGTMTGEAILAKIKTAELTETEREKRMFYAALYVGLNDAVEGRDESARQHLQLAANNRWAPVAGYGPHYMWQVARLHVAQLPKDTP